MSDGAAAAGPPPGPAVPRGLLGVPGRLPFRISRQPPAEDLAWLVDRFWSSAWDLPDGDAVTARVLPHPNVNLTVEGHDDTLVVTGTARGVWHRTLTGTGDVLGIKFTVGAFRLVSERAPRLDPVGEPAESLLPGGAGLRSALAGRSRAEQRTVLEDWLRRLRLEPTKELHTVQRAAAALLGDPAVTRVGQAAELVGVSERTLQRLFAAWVGLSPGWVLRRGRLHAAAERVIQLAAAGRSDGQERFADVAAEYGYADQAHFTNEFRRVLGAPPAAWAATLVTRTDPTPVPSTAP
ncbi:AraC-like DNA-binding protein [Friedmanniella endophytica]|uniref:AraC-like DNA-binding protein n=1 Tax=Microlunatus kandeliicorticis TaxID=1759536 RepID=A0A7W3P4U4_9ACTN|nr:helix-turn-helix domain-containing protein [Microlunatus kandeliicorticis]MBA8793197.1 AraC-like DNA-binding protein [Microlunatus kandeliicorticis]